MNNNTTKVIVELPKTFLVNLENIIDDEFTIAARKWNVRVSPEMREKILFHSKAQIKSRVESLMGYEWNFSNIVNVKVQGGNGGEVKLPSTRKIYENTFLIKSKNGWLVENDEKDKTSVSLSDFPQRVEETIIKWTRTAIFYGVGSLPKE